MPLKIELKPNERIIIGEALITNDGERTKFFIEGNAPILREKFIIKQEEATTPCKKIYYVVLQMYLSKTPMDLHKIYFTYVRDVQNAAPSLFRITSYNVCYTKLLRELINKCPRIYSVIYKISRIRV